jgi:hypothetical protein
MSTASLNSTFIVTLSVELIGMSKSSGFLCIQICKALALQPDRLLGYSTQKVSGVALACRMTQLTDMVGYWSEKHG